MKEVTCRITLLLLSLLPVFSVNGQKSVYTTTGGEWIFSWADATQNGADLHTIVRFSPVLNLQNQVHIDMAEKMGFFTGVSLRNVGFIYDDPTTVNTRYKARAYTLGIPIALKLGNLSGGNFLFGGYEIEFPFNYKEKKFVNEDKVDKNSSWFSSKTPGVYHTVLAGIQTRQGTQLKFKYYLTNFFNKGYAADDGTGTIVHPYQNLDANVFYVSLSFQILRGTHFYYEHNK